VIFPSSASSYVRAHGKSVTIVTPRRDWSHAPLPLL
jgi:hypothetical protein